MPELIVVDRTDGLAVASLLTGVLAQWDTIPLASQAAIIEHASAAALGSTGRDDGRYVVTAFVLRHRAALARAARLDQDGLGRLWRATLGRMADGRRRIATVASRWPLGHWLAAWRKAA